MVAKSSAISSLVSVAKALFLGRAGGDNGDVSGCSGCPPSPNVRCVYF